MKKQILTLITILIIAVGNAQEAKFGVKAGLNIATLSGDRYPDSQILPGFVIGGFAAVKLSEKFIFQPELLFSFQGTAYRNYYDQGYNDYYSQENMNLNYLLIPLMAKCYVAKKFSLEFGPQFGFLLAARTNSFNYTTIGDGAYDTNSVNIKDQFKTFDFGLNVGAGYDFTDKWGINLRYNFGLNNIAQNENTNYTSNNQVLSVTGSYKF
ncbi:porin family protein [Flavobacterium sp. N3904]|uniref:porin family protein n=1 Tax=Flavobacterium sp. N3904 TaxID=2986835 RepID=UPI002223F4E8|nr:porin family protein [Flavobacterium sp. N3904]